MTLIIPIVGMALGLAWIIFRTRFSPATEAEREQWAAAREARHSKEEEK